VKKYIPYVLGAILLIALGTLLMSSIKNRPKQLNERVTLKERDKIPYGFYAARQMLPSLFPNASIYNDKRSPGYWDSLSTTGDNQAVFMIGIAVKADEYEIEEMVAFAQKGNYVFVITQEFSYDLTKVLNTVDLTSDEGYFNDKKDSLKLRLSHPRFKDTSAYVYPGRRFSAYFSSVDTTDAIVLGENEEGRPNFIQLKSGSGAVFIHAAPLAFSNYFLLHKNNIGYFQKAVSVIPADVNRVVWNEYYLNKRTEDPKSEPNFLGVLLKHEAFRWALLVAIATLVVYVLSEMRRKQRIIPDKEKPKNESLDFVTTIGQLYYDRKDHANLARKMSTYFLDHVRNQFKVSTNVLDDSFIQTLNAKTSYPEVEIRSIVNFMKFVDGADITEYQLNSFYQQLEKFYQNT
jgi:hypothetical protein